ncbi:hypothetical protein JW949_02400 [Candidatus Woesearchaeota archaeon]|nr:hypothetical protein [Candidatus Woesearchaeota archaeon]
MKININDRKGVANIIVLVILALLTLIIIYIVAVNKIPSIGKYAVDETDLNKCNIFLDLDEDDEKNIDDECPCDAYAGKEYYHIDMSNKDLSKSIKEKCENVPLVKEDNLYFIEEDFETECVLTGGVSEEFIEKEEGRAIQYCITSEEECDELLKKECALKKDNLKINTDLS